MALIKKDKCPVCGAEIPLWKHIGHSRRFGFPCSGCGTEIRSRPNFFQRVAGWGLLLIFLISLIMTEKGDYTLFLWLIIALVFLLMLMLRKSEKIEVMYKKNK